MTTTSEVQVGWQDYVTMALRRKKFFLAPLIGCLVVGGTFFMLSPRVYRAAALIAVNDEKLINPLIQGLAVPTALSDRMQTLREEILSWSNLTRLIEKHRLDEGIDSSNKLKFDWLVKKLRESITVRLTGASLIEVSYEGHKPAKVQNVVNSLTDIVINRSAIIQEKEAKDAIGFIQGELAVYRAKLEKSESKLRDFKELYMTQMPVATALNSQLRDLELQLSNLLIDNTEKHPSVIETKRKIEEVRRQRDEEIRRLVERGVLKSADPKLYGKMLDQMSVAQAALVEGLEAPEVPTAGGPQVAVSSDGTVQVSDAAAASLTLAPRQQQELVRLTRDYSVNESIYRGLLEKLERAKITNRLGEDEEGGKFVVIERARYPLKPIKPNPIQVLLITLVAGIGLGIGLVLLTEYLDQSITSSDEAVDLLDGFPVLGMISTIVTESDLEAKRANRKRWFSLKGQLQWLQGTIFRPVWTRIDHMLLRLGL